MMARIVAAMLALTLAVPAAAAQRGYSVTSFERIQVHGPFVVRVTTGRGSSARAEGDQRAIDEIAVQVVGNTLRVRRNVSNSWGGYPGERENLMTLLKDSDPQDVATVQRLLDSPVDPKGLAADTPKGLETQVYSRMRMTWPFFLRCY